MSNDFLLVEKYRPQTIDECILPERIKNELKSHITTGNIPNFILEGPQGIGKTTVAKALCNEVDAEYLFINGSEETGIDVLRSKIKGFASTVSLNDALKVVIIDEADGMNANSLQPALRSFIEDFSDNCRFIFTCNYLHKIIKPLHSRFAVINFKIDNDDKALLMKGFYKRVLNILKEENIDSDPKVIATLIKNHFPDFRRVLNEIQRYSPAGKIDSDILVNYNTNVYKELVPHLAGKKFNEVRKWVAENTTTDSTKLFRELYDASFQILHTESVPQLVLILADYQYKSAFVADQEINLMACLTELMSTCRFKD